MLPLQEFHWAGLLTSWLRLRVLYISLAAFWGGDVTTWSVWETTRQCQRGRHTAVSLNITPLWAVWIHLPSSTEGTAHSIVAEHYSLVGSVGALAITAGGDVAEHGLNGVTEGPWPCLAAAQHCRATRNATVDDRHGCWELNKTHELVIWAIFK